MKSGLREVRIASAALALTLVGGPASAATNLFTNGSFETGNLSGWKVLSQGFSACRRSRVRSEELRQKTENSRLC